jgi:hypothetical protein
MPIYRIYRIKEGPRETFRWAAHTGGTATVKIKDYDPSGEIEAATPYAAWKALTAHASPIHPGDLLESVSAEGSGADLRIAKYIGFEPAQWYVPEVKTDLSASTLPSSPSSVAAES